MIITIQPERAYGLEIRSPTIQVLNKFKWLQDQWIINVILSSHCLSTSLRFLSGVKISSPALSKQIGKIMDLNWISSSCSLRETFPLAIDAHKNLTFQA